MKAMENQMQMMQNLQNAAGNVDNYECDNCGCQTFHQLHTLKELPALMTGLPAPYLLNIPVYFCSECGQLAAPSANTVRFNPEKPIEE